jgi:hypothetical protein
MMTFNIKNETLYFKPKEIYELIGPHSSGKTNFLKILLYTHVEDFKEKVLIIDPFQNYTDLNSENYEVLSKIDTLSQLNIFLEGIINGYYVNYLI